MPPQHLNLTPCWWETWTRSSRILGVHHNHPNHSLPQMCCHPSVVWIDPNNVIAVIPSDCTMLLCSVQKNEHVWNPQYHPQHNIMSNCTNLLLIWLHHAGFQLHLYRAYFSATTRWCTMIGCLAPTYCTDRRSNVSRMRANVAHKNMWTMWRWSLSQ